MPSFEDSKAARVLLPVPLVPPNRMMTQHCPSLTFELMSKSIKLRTRSKPHLQRAQRTKVLNFARLSIKLVSSASNVTSRRAPARAKERMTENIHATAASARAGLTPTSCSVLLRACELNHCRARWLVHNCSMVASGDPSGRANIFKASPSLSNARRRTAASSATRRECSNGRMDVVSLALCHTDSQPTTMKVLTQEARSCASSSVWST